jgi:hypothetical protein
METQRNQTLTYRPIRTPAEPRHTPISKRDSPPNGDRRELSDQATPAIAPSLPVFVKLLAFGVCLVFRFFDGFSIQIDFLGPASCFGLRSETRASPRNGAGESKCLPGVGLAWFLF